MVSREFEVEFRGEVYTVTPSMRVLRSIENEVSLARMAHGFMVGEPQTTHLAFVLAKLINTDPKGVMIKDEDVFQELNSGKPAVAASLFEAVMAAIFPQVDEKKEKPVADK